MYTIVPDVSPASNTNTLIEVAKSKGLFVGSRAWGLSGTNSDYDYVVLLADIEKYIDSHMLQLYAQYSSLPSYGFKIKGPDQVIDIIVAKDTDMFECWKQAAHLFTSMISNPLIQHIACEKRVRVRLFEACRIAAELPNRD